MSQHTHTLSHRIVSIPGYVPQPLPRGQGRPVVRCRRMSKEELEKRALAAKKASSLARQLLVARQAKLKQQKKAQLDEDKAAAYFNTRYFECLNKILAA